MSQQYKRLGRRSSDGHLVMFQDESRYVCPSVVVQEVPQPEWTIINPFATNKLLIQIFDETNSVIIPESVTVSESEIVVMFSHPTAGKLLILADCSEDKYYQIKSNL